MVPLEATHLDKCTVSSKEKNHERIERTHITKHTDPKSRSVVSSLGIELDTTALLSPALRTKFPVPSLSALPTWPGALPFT